MTRRDRVPAIPSDAKVVLPASASRHEWLAERQHSIGASEVAAIVGASPYATAFETFRAKTEGWFAPEFEGNVFTEWGQRLEDAIIGKAVDELGLVARPGGQIWRHPSWSRVHATPDAFVTRPRSWKAVGVIEAKTAGDGDGWADGGAPLHYRAQVQVQLGTLGLDRGWLACLELSAARTFHLVEIVFDRDWFRELMGVAHRFWTDHVETGEPPMHDLTHPRTDQLLKDLHPAAVLPSVELPDDAGEWVERYRDAKAEAERAGKRLDEAKNWIKVQMGDAGAGYIGDQNVVSFPEVTTTRIDTTKLRENFAEAAAACEITSTHRRLTVRAFKK